MLCSSHGCQSALRSTTLSSENPVREAGLCHPWYQRHHLRLAAAKWQRLEQTKSSEGAPLLPNTPHCGPQLLLHHFRSEPWLFESSSSTMTCLKSAFKRENNPSNVWTQLPVPPQSLPFSRPNMLLTRYFSKMDKTTSVRYTSVNFFFEVNRTLQMRSERGHCLPGTQFKEVSVIIYLRLHSLFYKPSAQGKPFAQSVHTLP